MEMFSSMANSKGSTISNINCELCVSDCYLYIQRCACTNVIIIISTVEKFQANRLLCICIGTQYALATLAHYNKTQFICLYV